jgi:hypothetical protein
VRTLYEGETDESRAAFEEDLLAIYNKLAALSTLEGINSRQV